jgi:hypothetical protein
MGAGTFVVRPRNQTAVTCALAYKEYTSDASVPYQVLARSINWKEEERRKFAYREGGFGGQIAGEKAGLVTAEFRVEVFGTTELDAQVNLRALERVLTECSGHIEFQPKLTNQTVMSTFYHYLPSSPPKMVSRGGIHDERLASWLIAFPGMTYGYCILVDFKVQIKAWATSDPDTLVTIVAQQTIDNCEDTTRSNAVVVPASSVKGDVIFPLIIIQANTGESDDQSNLLIHKRERLNTGAYDWYEAELADESAGWTVSIDGSASYGQNLGTSAVIETATWEIAAMDSTLVGRITPILCAKIALDSDPYTVYFRSRLQDGGIVDDSGEVSIVHEDNWVIYTAFSEILYPPIAIPNYVTDSSTPDINAFLDRMEVQLLATIGQGSGSLYLDFIYLAAINDGAWIAEFDYANTDTLDHTGANRLEIDVLSGGAWIIRESDDATQGVWSKQGMPYSDLVIRRGFDSVIRFFVWDMIMPPGIGWNDDYQIDVTIQGIYGTIYPFEES